MQLSDRNLCDGTGMRFSLFWAIECPYGVPCEGCQGCGWNLFLKIWESVGQITYAYSVPGILARRVHYSRTIPGTLASMIGKSDTAQRHFAGIPNRRFYEATLLRSVAAWFPTEDITLLGVTCFRGSV